MSFVTDLASEDNLYRQHKQILRNGFVPAWKLTIGTIEKNILFGAWSGMPFRNEVGVGGVEGIILGKATGEMFDVNGKTEADLMNLHRFNQALIESNNLMRRLGSLPFRAIRTVYSDRMVLGATVNGILGINLKYLRTEMPEPGTTFGTSLYEFGKEEILMPDFVSEYFPDGMGRMRALVIHETGHLIHQMAKVKTMEQFNNWPRPLERSFLNRLRPEIIHDAASRYGREDPEDWFAENLVLWYTGKDELVNSVFDKWARKNMVDTST